MKSKFLNICIDVTKTATKIPQSSYLHNGIYPIYDQGKDLIGGYRNDSKGLVKDYPYIVFGDHTRVIKYVNNPCFIGADGVKLIKVIDDKFLPKYVFYSLTANPVVNHGYSRHYKFLKETTINYVDKVIQEKIVRELDNIYNFIALNVNKINLLDELIKSRFIEMFGEPLNPKNDLYKKTFRDICVVRQGLQIPISKRFKEGGINRYPYITIQYLNGKKEKEYIENPPSTVICYKDDILMTRTGNTGQVISGNEGVFHNNFFIVDYNRMLMNRKYLLEYLKMDEMHNELLRKASNTTIPDLSHDKFYSCVAVVPPIELQNKFASFVEQIDKSKLVIKKRIEVLQELLEKKMQEYFG